MVIGISPILFSLQGNHLGGGLSNYIHNPTFWSFANFDGEHYISIATYGYKPLQYFFFPLYPYLIGALSLTKSMFGIVLTGQIISNTLFFVSLIGLWKLVRLDYQSKIANLVVILLLIFPTSFYFAAVYTESLFLALVVWSFYFSRKKNFLLTSILAGLASATRIIGVIMLPVLFIEWFQQDKKDRSLKQLAFLGLSGLGIVAYMFYLHMHTGNALEFKTSLEYVYGEQRSDALVLLPQVIYRYIFKILPSMNWSYFAGSFSLLLEFMSGILFLILSIISFFKLRKSYAAYLIAGYLIPTLSGSFSSMSRYVLVLFPGFILMAIYVEKLPQNTRYTLYIAMIVCLAIATALFSRGYWIA